MKKNKIYQGDALKTLKTFPDESINCVMTSPPYWALRDYGTANWIGGKKSCDHEIPKSEYDPKRKYSSHVTRFNLTKCYKCGAKRDDKQLGLETTFEEYIAKMCDVFDEVKRVLRKDGTCWVNYGDTYNAGRTGGWAGGKKGISKPENAPDQSGVNAKGIPAKSLTMIPFRFAIEMVNRGWILRNVIIWHKPNPMPSSAKDRFTVDFEYLFFFSKSKKYWFEQQFEKYTKPLDRWGGDRTKAHRSKGSGVKGVHYPDVERELRPNPSGRNTRTVWKIPTQPFPEAHFAVYPEKLCITPIKAGCPEFICKKCGKAREKILEPTEEYKKHLGKSWHGHKQDMVEGNIKKGKSLTPEYKVKGLTDCGCKAGFRKGIVLDPFMGAGTTAVVARKLGRNYVGIELNPKYIKIAEKRLQQRVLI